MTLTSLTATSRRLLHNGWKLTITDGPTEVAAALGPFVGLLGQYCADEADDRIAEGEDWKTLTTSCVI